MTRSIVSMSRPMRRRCGRMHRKAAFLPTASPGYARKSIRPRPRLWPEADLDHRNRGLASSAFGLARPTLLATKMSVPTTRRLSDHLPSGAASGYPEAHEDDAERAVRAGLALIEAMTAIQLPVPLSPQVRVG